MRFPVRPRRPLPVTVALMLLASPAFAAETAAPPAPPAPAAPAGEASREDTQRQLEGAQRRLDEAVREVERLSSQLGARFGDRFVRGPMTQPRAMLGVQISSTERGGGAHVMAVSPGGPAEAAGIKQGDVIVAIDGKDISKADNPDRELVESMRGKEPDRKVKVRLSRDGKTREVEVTPRAAPQVFAFRGPDDVEKRFRFVTPGRPGGPGPLPGPGSFNLRVDPPDGPEGDGRWERGVPLAGMELATVSERLGRYFGSKDGVLVVRAGGNEAFKLQDGDVILKIDGREPNSASHATRILRSYQRGEKMQLTIMRDHKTQNLDVTLPGG